APRSGSTKLVIGVGSSVWAGIELLDAQHSISSSSAQSFSSTPMPPLASCDTSRPSGATNRATQLDTFENEQELSGLNHHVAKLRAPRGLEYALLKAFRNQHVTVAVPIQHADTIAAPRKEHVQRSRERVLRELRPNEHRETVDALPSVDARGRDEYARSW